MENGNSIAISKKGALNQHIKIDPDLQLFMQKCPLCQGTEFRLLSRHDRHFIGLHTVGCKNCGLIQTNPRPSESGLVKFYQEYYRALYQGVITPSQEYIHRFHKDVRLNNTAQYLLNDLSIPTDGSLLDYGCAEGSLFVALRRNGFEGILHGIEPNIIFASYASTLSKSKVFSSINEVGSYHTITINHVLEHLADPLKVLVEIRLHLQPNGVLYIDVPDARQYRNAGDLHFAHLWHFTPSTLVALINRAGFEVIKCEAHRPIGHPPSLRVLSIPSHYPLNSQLPGSNHNDAWTNLRRIEKKAWLWTLKTRFRQLLSRVPPFRWAIRLIRAYQK